MKTTPSGQRSIITPGQMIHHISARGTPLLEQLREAAKYRELLWMLALRDIKIRYKQTFLGAVWVILQPLMFVGVGLMLLKFVGRGQSSVGTAGVMLLCGTLPWQMFANIVSRSAESVVANSGILSKVYFPRLLIPIAGAGSALLDFAIGCITLLIWIPLSGRTFPPQVVTLPFIIFFGAVAACGLGIWLAAVSVKYRDVRYLIPVFLQLGVFLSPVFYPLTAVPERWRPLYALNPNAAFVSSFRWAVLGEAPPDAWTLGIGVAVAALLMVAALSTFSRTQSYFADLA